MPNHLATEKSPYLLQHADNPVDWYPWGDAAFAKARAEDKPIFVSIGYSTCHWCHVMAHESFENEAVARVLNANFVPVKVDREERPDVDHVYMVFVQATTGSGGWPMSVWLTPELEPFYGGTYFPPTAAWGRPGFIDVLEEIARAWREDRVKVRRSAANVIAQMQQLAARGGRQPGAPAVSSDALERAVVEFAETFDGAEGGFGGAPKFPRPSDLFFLMREFARLRSGAAPGATAGRRDDGTAARDMALVTLHAMARGGIHDHLGGGFHRYSVDARWHVPHFEKMLYDQAQLALAYLEAFQVSGERQFADVAADVLRYTARDLRDPGGAFHSAEDADSVPAGSEHATPREGAFYVWTAAELADLLGEDAPLAALRYGVLPEGNVASDPHGEFEGRNVLYLARRIDEVAAHVHRPATEVAERLEQARRRLFEARRERPRPGLDDKVIVAWNGLTIGAFSRASRVIGAEWLAAAQQAATFIREKLWDPANGRLLRRYRNGEAAVEAFAGDFACLVFGLLELFQADGDAAWLEWAIALQRRQDELFWDQAHGGWFNTTGRDPSVLLRFKEESDGAEPAASSVSAWNLLGLSRLTGEGKWSARAEHAIAAFSHELERAPTSMPMMLAAASSALASTEEIVVVGEPGGDDTAKMLAALASRYLPFAVVVPLSSGRQAEASRFMPFVQAMTKREGRATAYVCRNFACNQPTTDADEMMRQLA